MRGFRERADRRIPEIPDKVNRDIIPESWAGLYGRKTNESVNRPILVVNETITRRYDTIPKDCSSNKENFFDLARTRTEMLFLLSNDFYYKNGTFIGFIKSYFYEQCIVFQSEIQCLFVY